MILSIRNFILSLFLGLGVVFTGAACGGVEEPPAIDAQLEATLEGGIDGELVSVDTVSEALYAGEITCEVAPTVCSQSKNCYWCDYGVGRGCICFDKPLGR